MNSQDIEARARGVVETAFGKLGQTPMEAQVDLSKLVTALVLFAAAEYRRGVLDAVKVVENHIAPVGLRRLVVEACRALLDPPA